MKRSNYLFFYFLTLFLQLKMANDDEYIYQLLEFMRPGPKTKKSVDFVPSHWISYVLELEYANRTYTGIHNYSHTQTSSYQRLGPKGSYTWRFMTPPPDTDYPQRSKVTITTATHRVNE